MGGPLLFIPLSSIIGRSSLIFWSLFGSLASNIWAPLMTGPNDYIPFVMSRMLAGLFGSIPPVLAAGLIMDLYFLHQRGKAFAVLEVSLLAGAVAAPVFGGFIADTKPWPDVFWWLVALIAVSIPLGMASTHSKSRPYSHLQHFSSWKRRAFEEMKNQSLFLSARVRSSRTGSRHSFPVLLLYPARRPPI